MKISARRQDVAPTFGNGGIPKIEKFGWTINDQPGTYALIHKSDLHIDHDHYQRLARQSKVVAIARDWSWLAIGALAVARRPDGSHYVIDGQHRKVAADHRSDIDYLPCMVFEVASVVDEAKGFLKINTRRASVDAIAKLKADISAKNPIALATRDLIEMAGREARHGSDPTSLKCVGTVQRLLERDEAVLRRIWPLLVRLTTGHVFHERLLLGLFYVESHMPEGESVTRVRWANKLEAIGYDGLMTSIGKACAYYAKGGERVFGDGIVQALNHKARNKLVLA